MNHNGFKKTNQLLGHWQQGCSEQLQHNHALFDYP